MEILTTLPGQLGLAVAFAGLFGLGVALGLHLRASRAKRESARTSEAFRDLLRQIHERTKGGAQ